MNYYSTNKTAPVASLQEAVVRGLAPDRGLYMPERINPLPASFFEELPGLSFREMSCRVAAAFFGEDLSSDTIRKLVYDTLNFETPLVRIDEPIYSLELFHGPTLA
ncbi:MAG: threonine synthase, partial [Bacteroidales bacterium]|nr:threonine synthase [Bacteroidales bacterium]